MFASTSRVALAALLGVGLTGAAWAQGAPQRPHPPAGARVYFEWPADGAHVGPTVIVRAGLHAMGVAPSGEPVPNTGHHHLLIDAQLPSLNEPLPINNQIVHFSNGETEIQVTLPRGWHKLQLVFADAAHLSFDPPVISKPIHIYVRSR